MGSTEEKEKYRKEIVKMVGEINNEKILKQIYTILKMRIEKRGG